MDVRIALEKSKQWMILCWNLVDGASFVASHRTRVVASLHHLCIEHHSGIVLLCDNGVHGSAFALHRPQFEAYIRGAWFHHCADDQQIQKFLDGNDPPKVDDMIRQLETLEPFKGGMLSRAKMETWRSMNAFTHGGAIQIKARNTSDEIVQSFTSEHVAGLLTTAATLALLAGVGIAEVAEQTSLAIDLQAGYRSIYGAAK